MKIEIEMSELLFLIIELALLSKDLNENKLEITAISLAEDLLNTIHIYEIKNEIFGMFGSKELVDFKESYEIEYALLTKIFGQVLWSENEKTN